MLLDIPRNEFGMREDDFEKLRLYKADSKIGKLVGDKVKSVFEKMFNHMGIDSNDFIFMCFHDDEPNAFFINKDNTNARLKKHVIAVSDLMIKRLDCEEELAAVIAHECGHYIWQNNITDNNTIVQERWSDVMSVDFLMNAGYNPLYILEMQKKVFSNFSYSSVDFGVHGTGFARSEDVKARLTVLGAERGDFEKIEKEKNPDWAIYQQTFLSIYNKEGYNTYIEKLLIDKFGTKDLEKIDRIAFLQLILENIKNNNILMDVRINDFNNKLRHLNFDNNFKTRSHEEILLLQDIFYAADKEWPKGYVKSFLYEAHLDFFGPFAEMNEYIKNFIAAVDDEEKLIFYAEKIDKLKWVMDYRDCFTVRFAKFTAYEEENVGKMLTYDKLMKNKNQKVMQAMNIIRGLHEYRFYLDYIENDYYLDENGIVLYYGEEAKRQHDKDMENTRKGKDKRILEENKNSVDLFVSYLNALADFATGKISEQDFIKNFKPFYYFGLDKFSYNDYTYEMKELYKKVYSSRGYDYFFGGNNNPKDKDDVFVYDYADINTYVEKINQDFYPSKLLQYERYLNVVYKLAKDLVYSNSLTENIFNIYYDVFVDSAIYNNVSQQYLIYFSNLFAKTYFIFSKHKIPVFVKENFMYKEESQYIKNILNQLIGKDKISNEDELIRVLGLINDKDLAFYVWAEFLRHGGYADLIKVIETITKHDNHQYYDKISGAEIISDILGQFISDSQFDSLSLYEQICYYEFIKYNNLFSDKHANQNKYIKKIVDSIVYSSIKNDKNISYAYKFLSRNPISKYGKKSKSDIEFYAEREKLIEYYSTYLAEKLGRDDGSEEYLAKVRGMLDELQIQKSDENVFSGVIKKSVLNRVSEKVISQEKAAKIMGVASSFNVAEIAKNDEAIRAAEATFGVLARNPDAVIIMINFLSSKLTENLLNDTLMKFNKKLRENNPMLFNKSNLMLIHENFWGMDLPVRAYLMNRLLNSYSEKDQDKLDLILSMYFDKQSEYYKDAKLVINAIYNNLQDYERNLIIAALASAGQRDNSETLSGGRMVGQGLKMFLQNKGPAFIKFGQLLSYLPTLDSDIRAELATLRDKANIPERSDLFDILKMALPESEINKISYVGKLLGAGSFYITVQVVYDGRPAVISVMRPYAQDLTNSGLDMISNTINDLVKADKKYAPLKNILEQAKESALSEIDIQQDYKKFRHAKNVYEQFKVTTGDATYSPDVAQWLAYGAAPDGQNAYKIMEMAPGNSLMYDMWTEQEKHDFAVAYVTLELALLLSGEKWDTDRHQGQQNFYNSDFRNFCIGIFDTGAQMNKGPGTKDKVMLGHLMYELALGAKSGHGIGETLVKIIKNIDTMAEKLNIDTSYIDGVQRGLTALSDIIEYQKEQKDDSGRIIKESKSLTATDFENIINAIYKSGVIDKTVEKTVMTKAVLDKLMIWRSGLSFSGHSSVSGEDSYTGHPVVLEYSPNDKSQVKSLAGIMKGQEEIEKILAVRQKNPLIGMNVVENNRDNVVSLA